MRPASNTRYYTKSSGQSFAEARFYDADNRTWLAIDLVKDGENWYQYCCSNPSTYYDPTGLAGFSPFTGCVDVNELTEQVDLDEVNEFIQTVKAFGQCADGTYTVGIDVSLTPGIWQYDGTIGISIDAKGNVALQGTLMVGPATGGAAAGVLEYKTITTASSVYDLEGVSTQAGGSMLFLIQEGLPFLGMVGGELHVQWGNTTTFYSMNLFDLWDSIYEKNKPG